jgi:6-phosphogluconolactonase (cycloisomerase 2 family)
VTPDSVETSRVVTTIPTVDVGDSFPSAIPLAPNGRWCFIANRGPDTIAVISVRGPVVRLHANASCRCEQPRDLALSPDGRLLYVANQETDAVRTFRIDDFTGLPTPIGEPLQVSRPTCVLLSRRHRRRVRAVRSGPNRDIGPERVRWHAALPRHPP